ncbi:MAG: hypothetical protein WDN24_04100 [Sphingomonas sp.]
MSRSIFAGVASFALTAALIVVSGTQGTGFFSPEPLRPLAANRPQAAELPAFRRLAPADLHEEAVSDTDDPRGCASGRGERPRSRRFGRSDGKRTNVGPIERRYKSSFS